MEVIVFPFIKIVKVYSTAYYRLKRSSADTFLELQAFYRSYENFGKCPGKTPVPLSKFQVLRLQPLVLPSTFVKLKITCAVKFIFTEAGAIRFSTRDLSTQF